VKSVARSILPRCGCCLRQRVRIASGSIDELKAEITATSSCELKRKIEAKVKEQALAAADNGREFAVPKSLVEQEAQNMAQRMTAELKEKGMAPTTSSSSRRCFARTPRSVWRLALRFPKVGSGHELAGQARAGEGVGAGSGADLMSSPTRLCAGTMKNASG
jgi:trigger factor